jgi:hypothetical protein
LLAGAAAALTGRVLFAEPATQPASAPASQPAAFDVIGTPTTDADTQITRWTVRSAFQRGENALLVLPPPQWQPVEALRLLLLLPVEEGLGSRWGDPLAEVRKTRLHERHRLLCVMPAFDTLPWFGRHATDPTIRHERYLLDVVLPLIESRYPLKPGIDARWLVGFSKSGFGAISLLLRHSKVFGRAGCWDAPLMMEPRDLGLFGTKGHFGTEAVFSEYLPTRLLAVADADFRTRARLVLAGADSFGPNPPARFKATPHLETFHRLLDEHQFKHVYRDDLKVKHHWNTGWLGPVVDELAKL